MRYCHRPTVIEASQWFKNGDHPDDGEERFPPKSAASDPRYTGEFAGERYEGKVVRYFRRPDVPGDTGCRQCGRTMHVHGWIDTPEGGHIVCPGDWVITGIQGEHYPCKPDIFAATYDSVEESQQQAQQAPGPGPGAGGAGAGGHMTFDELDALPEHCLGVVTHAETDPTTGHTTLVRESIGFLVNRSEVYVYRDREGQFWEVAEHSDGKMWKQRIL